MSENSKAIKTAEEVAATVSSFVRIALESVQVLCRRAGQNTIYIDIYC